MQVGADTKHLRIACGRGGTHRARELERGIEVGFGKIAKVAWIQMGDFAFQTEGPALRKIDRARRRDATRTNRDVRFGNANFVVFQLAPKFHAAARIREAGVDVDHAIATADRDRPCELRCDQLAVNRAQIERADHAIERRRTAVRDVVHLIVHSLLRAVVCKHIAALAAYLTRRAEVGRHPREDQRPRIADDIRVQRRDRNAIAIDGAGSTIDDAQRASERITSRVCSRPAVRSWRVERRDEWRDVGIDRNVGLGQSGLPTFWRNAGDVQHRMVDRLLAKREHARDRTARERLVLRIGQREVRCELQIGELACDDERRTVRHVESPALGK